MRQRLLLPVEEPPFGSVDTLPETGGDFYNRDGCRKSPRMVYSPVRSHRLSPGVFSAEENSPVMLIFFFSSHSPSLRLLPAHFILWIRGACGRIRQTNPLAAHYSSWNDPAQP